VKRAAWIYLSPHFDDAVLSCGGLIWQQARAGQSVSIWTVCAGEIPAGPLTPFAEELHARWGTGLLSVAARRAEDEAACRIVGAAPRYFNLPDCIYRRLPDSGEPVVTQNDDLWLHYRPGEAGLIARIRDWLVEGLPPGPASPASKKNPGGTTPSASDRAAVQGRPAVHLAAPLSVGGHMDHRLVRAAADLLGWPLWYYADYPYAARQAFDPIQWLGRSRRVYARTISPEGLSAWQAGVAAYASQLSTFWQDPDELRSALAAYARSIPGHTLWKKT
jgi:LmbE family N-acetylglucosaminyl deacetylase